MNILCKHDIIIIDDLFHQIKSANARGGSNMENNNVDIITKTLEETSDHRLPVYWGLVEEKVEFFNGVKEEDIKELFKDPIAVWLLEAVIRKDVNASKIMFHLVGTDFRLPFRLEAAKKRIQSNQDVQLIAAPSSCYIAILEKKEEEKLEIWIYALQT